jgi:hypothetical protein
VISSRIVTWAGLGAITWRKRDACNDLVKNFEEKILEELNV